jgi:hypothetical protein
MLLLLERDLERTKRKQVRFEDALFARKVDEEELGKTREANGHLKIVCNVNGRIGTDSNQERPNNAEREKLAAVAATWKDCGGLNSQHSQLEGDLEASQKQIEKLQWCLSAAKDVRDVYKVSSCLV